MPIILPASTSFRADLSGTAFVGVPTWTDLTAYVLAEGQGEAITITWGRQDEEADVVPTVMTILLDNQDGRFTPQLATGPYYPHVKRGFRANLRLTVGTPTYDRFDGYCAEITQAWPGGSEGWSVVRMTFVDMTARLAAASPLRSMVVQEMLADSPSWLYPLDEQNPSVSAGNISPNQIGAAIGQNSKYGAGSMSFGTSMPGLSDAGVAFDAPNAGAAGHLPGSYLSLPLTARVPVSGAHTIECWLVSPNTPPAKYMVFSHISNSSAVGIFLFIGPAGNVQYQLENGAVLSLANAGSVCDGKPHHIAATLEADRITSKLYIDGVLAFTATTGGTPITFPLVDRIQFGSLAYIDDTEALRGTLSNVAMYPTALSAARVLAHYQAGTGTLVERSDLRFSRLCGYANLPPLNQISLASSSFEDGTIGSWSAAPAGYTAVTLANSSTFASFGSKSMLLTWPTAAANVAAASLNVTGLLPEALYTLSLSVRVPAGSPAVKIGEGYGAFTTVNAPGFSNTSSASDVFQRLAITFRAHATSGAFVITAPAGSTAGQTVYVDDVQVLPGSNAGNFKAKVGPQNTAGRTVTDCLKQVAGTEGNPAFVTPAGIPTFLGREIRYDAAAAVTLTGADIDPGFSPRDDGQNFFNEMTVSRDGGSTQVALDAALQATDGRIAASGLSVCSSTDEDAFQNASWQVGTHKVATLRAPSVLVDLLTQPTLATTQALLDCSIGSLLTIAPLPANAPASSMSWFVEGGREVIGRKQWDIEFFTSPNLPGVWQCTVANDPLSATDGSMLVGF